MLSKWLSRLERDTCRDDQIVGFPNYFETSYTHEKILSGRQRHGAYAVRDRAVDVTEMHPGILSQITPASRPPGNLLQSAIPLANAVSEDAAAITEYARE
jgi:hypothetical protein